MGKKDFLKFPSKKTMEYILIGILFVAVLSCTMKMMKGSFIEGFTCNLPGPSDTCTSVGLGTTPATGAYHLVGTNGMQTITAADAIGALIINIRGLDILLNFDERGTTAAGYVVASAQDNTAAALIEFINNKIKVHNAVAFLDGVNKLNIVVFPNDDNTAAITISYTSGASDKSTEWVTALGLGQMPSTEVATPIADCSALYTLLDSANPPLAELQGRTNAPGLDHIAGYEAGTNCIPVCEVSGPAGTCPGTGAPSESQETQAGCELADGGAGCECGPNGGLGEMAFYSGSSTWPYQYENTDGATSTTIPQIKGLSINDTNSCLMSAIEQSKTSNVSEYNPKNADFCHPRWPCISNMSDYLDILNTPYDDCKGDGGTDGGNDTENYKEDNTVRVSMCVPNVDSNDTEYCTGHHDLNSCIADTVTVEGDEKSKCIWNPYCQETSGRKSIQDLEDATTSVTGNATGGEREARNYEDMLSCTTKGKVWDLPMMESLNHERDTDGLLTGVTPIIGYTGEEGITNPNSISALVGGRGLGCQEDNLAANILCALTSATQNTFYDRIWGQCPSGSTACGTDGDNGLCNYCRTANNNPNFTDDAFNTLAAYDVTGVFEGGWGEDRNCIHIYPS